MKAKLLFGLEIAEWVATREVGTVATRGVGTVGTRGVGTVATRAANESAIQSYC